jgi:hypothetical protein
MIRIIAAATLLAFLAACAPRAFNPTTQPAAPTSVHAEIVNAGDIQLTWRGDAPFYTVNRKYIASDKWTDWETISNKQKAIPNPNFYDDAVAPTSSGIQYEVGSWSDSNTPPNDSQWGLSNTVQNDGPQHHN